MAFKITSVKTRYFEFEAPDNNRVLLLEPPKLKTLKKMEDIQKNKDAGIEDLAALLARIISKNKQQRKVSADQVMDWMDMDQMREFTRAFLDWLKQEHKSDPN